MIQFDIDKLNHSLDEVRALLDPQCRLHLGEESKKRIAKCRNYLDEPVLARSAMFPWTRTSCRSSRRTW